MAHRADDDDYHAETRGHALKMEAAMQEELMAGLWEEAVFVQLPMDAPAEVRAFVTEIKSPRRLYAIHKAARRHNFQLLVERYITQLRIGCGSDKCFTATCFSCRKRLAGKSPIRRYSPTSARILAVYLASQDNPEKALCTNLSRLKENTSAVNSLIFSTRHIPAEESAKPYKPRSGTHREVPGEIEKSLASSTTRRSRRTSRNTLELHCRSSGHRDVPPTGKDSPVENGLSSKPQICVTEKPTAKDYRSFAATAFGTAAFRMLEWLTPQTWQALSSKVSELVVSAQNEPGSSNGVETTTSVPVQIPPNQIVEANQISNPSPIILSPRASSQTNQPMPPRSEASDLTDGKEEARWTIGKDMPNRFPPKAETIKRRSLESKHIKSDVKNSELRSERAASPNGFKQQPLSRRTKPDLSASPIADISIDPLAFDHIPPTSQRIEAISSDEEDGTPHSHELTLPTVSPAESQSSVLSDSKDIDGALEDLDLTKTIQLPQSLTRLNFDLINFICDVYQEDHTDDRQFSSVTESENGYPKPLNEPPKFRRQCQQQDLVTKQQWQAFNDQVLFDTLSEPSSLIDSFTTEGKLYDSQTLWYCMVRLTRVAPRIVLHSLWCSSGNLFVPPASFQKLYASSKNPRQSYQKSLTKYEAGCVLSTGFHALVALAPVVSNSRTLYDMSRVRSTGLVLPNSSAFPRHPPEMSLEYDDVFSNELAMRLARRLFCGFIAQRRFSELLVPSHKRGHSGSDQDVLQPLLTQLDLLNNGPARVLEFTDSERLLHETRVPTLLLDWARAVLLHEWDGKPEFSTDGPFYGALSFMATMFANRNVLLLGDIQFRVDYFSDRLDTMQVPVSWLTFNPNCCRSHILDFPYLFRPETLVSLFRSINFSRMSKAFEEASSLKTRMSTIVDPGSLITNPHHKVVLQDLLKTASSRYLVLEIGRGSVLRDAFDQLWKRQERELLRPLKVHLGEDSGEEGFDSGGVQQEFFRMVIAECLDPEYGAFAVDERTRMAWFVPGSIVEDWKFELMGLLVSLAIYNGLTLPVTFPKALYRKLLGEPVEELYHIADGWPELASGLTTLLEWDEKNGLIEDVFARTYEFSVPGLGNNITLEMSKRGSFWPQGLPQVTDNTGAAEAPLVTNDNRDEYVSDYIRYLADVSVRPQFEAFQRGFRACLEQKTLTLLTPPILQSVVEGIQDIDVSELRRYTRYVGWDSSHHTIKDFWSIVRKFDDRMKRKLLEFVTASDRVPVGGLKNLQFVVQKNGEEDGVSGHLPTAYTCYGTLLLPEYRDKDVLRERLGMALENAQGFGFA